MGVSPWLLWPVIIHTQLVKHTHYGWINAKMPQSLYLNSRVAVAIDRWRRYLMERVRIWHKGVEIYPHSFINHANFYIQNSANKHY